MQQDTIDYAAKQFAEACALEAWETAGYWANVAYSLEVRARHEQGLYDQEEETQ